MRPTGNNASSNKPSLRRAISLKKQSARWHNDFKDHLDYVRGRPMPASGSELLPSHNGVICTSVPVSSA